jgi:hypothetical protein
MADETKSTTAKLRESIIAGILDTHGRIDALKDKIAQSVKQSEKDALAKEIKKYTQYVTDTVNAIKDVDLKTISTSKDGKTLVVSAGIFGNRKVTL